MAGNQVVVTVVLTEDYFKFWTQSMARGLLVPGTPTDTAATPPVWDARIKFFRIGEGGWYLQGQVRTRRTPDPQLRNPQTGLQDIDAACDIGRAALSQAVRYATDGRYYFDKLLTGADFAHVLPSSLEVTCRLDVGEFNFESTATAPAGGGAINPRLWEIGLFCDHPTILGAALMVAYGTFVTEEVKQVGRQLENVITITGVVA